MWTDLDRPPLRGADVARAPWREVEVRQEVDSTNAVVARAAQAGEAEGLVVVAETQTAGRGRLDREWVSPPRAGLTFSVLLRPVSLQRTLVPLLVGTAVADAIEHACDVESALKWPNDVLIGDRKVAGILAEVAAGAVVVGIGINVLTRSDELPEGATSLSVESDDVVDRLPVLLAVLRAIESAYSGWDEPTILKNYRRRCVTIGRDVRALLPGGDVIEGTAVDVDASGALVFDDGRVVSSADVVHLR